MLVLFDTLFLICSFGLLYWLKRKNIQLSFRILISLGLGIAYGLLLKWVSASAYLAFVKDLLYLVGHGYLSFLKMLVIPLILMSITHTILNVGTKNVNDIKKISIFTCTLLLSLTAIASLIGLAIGKLFSVGEGLNLPDFVDPPKHINTNLVDTLLGMLPSNPIASMAQENTIAIVLFAVLFGIAARMVDTVDHQKADIFKSFIDVLFATVKKLTVIVIDLTPYGIFALISLLLLSQGMTLLMGMLNFIAAMYTAMALMFVVHAITLFIAGQNPWEYFKNACTPLFVAFTTRSSFGTLPVTQDTLSKKFKTSEVIAAFVPSIGATIGMNGCAGIYPAMLVVMTLTILHQPLTLGIILMMVFINIIASLGISGIPGTAYIAATITLTSLHLPYAIIALVQGIDPIVDMGRTATNVNGAMTTAVILDRFISVPEESNDGVLETPKALSTNNIKP